MSPPSDTFDSNIGKIYGHCRLERKLGEGGMGMVYLATHTTLNKLVAIKVLRSDLGSDLHAAERFLREARSAAQIEHPAVVQVYDIGQADRTFYIVMQYVEGFTLESALKKHGILPLAEAMRIMKTICEGVREAHKSGIIHRDIKPDNILIGIDGSVKLADFGLARAVEGDPNLSQTGRIFGTPHFMSPEQGLGEKVDHRSDIFSIGATFYRTVTGRYPFMATTAVAVVYKLTHETPPPVKEVNPEVPPALSDLIAKMMARRPGDRVGSVDEVLRRLNEIASGGSNGPEVKAAQPPRKGRLPSRLPTGPLRPRGLPRKPRQAPAAVVGILALLVAGYLALNRCGLVPSIPSLIASAAPRPRTGPGPVDAVAAVKAAASLAAGQEGGGPGPTHGSKRTPGPPASRGGVEKPQPGAAQEPPSGPEAPETPESEKKAVSDPATAQDREALERRAADFLRDVREDPDRLSKYVDPQVRSERAGQLLKRMFTFLLEGRPKDAPPLKVGEVLIRNEGRAAEVMVQGVGRPINLRWIKRHGEWFLSLPRRRPDEG